MPEIIDAHAHIYPVKIAEKASKAIGDFYNINMFATGTAECLLAEGKAAGVSRFLVHSCATTTVQVRRINEFILEECALHKEFIPFMTLHPDMTEKELKSEINWAEDNGFKGVKLHSDFQKFYIDEDRAKKIYAALDDRLPVLFHMGDKRYDYSKPYRLCNVVLEFPRLKTIAAHFGGYSCWDEIDCYDKASGVCFDTSSSLAFLSPAQAKSFIGRFGEDMFFFGTDYPMWNAADELKRFDALGLSEKTREKILSGNIKKFLRLT